MKTLEKEVCLPYEHLGLFSLLAWGKLHVKTSRNILLSCFIQPQLNRTWFYTFGGFEVLAWLTHLGLDAFLTLQLFLILTLKTRGNVLSCTLWRYSMRWKGLVLLDSRHHNKTSESNVEVTYCVIKLQKS